MDNNGLSDTLQGVSENTRFAEKLKAYAFLRERFLHFLSSLPGEDTCTIYMHEDTKVTARIKAVDSNFQNVVVENLKTPLPDLIPKAILRTSDIVAIVQHSSNSNQKLF